MTPKNADYDSSWALVFWFGLKGQAAMQLLYVSGGGYVKIYITI